MIEVNKIKPGMILKDKKGKRYVVIETNLNGNDDYYSQLRVISENEYRNNIGEHIPDNKFKTSEWIGDFGFSEYEKCDGQYIISVEKFFLF